MLSAAHAGTFPAWPSTPWVKGNNTITTWMASPEPSTQEIDVKCNNIKVGKISLQYSAAKIEQGSNKTEGGGGYIRFGFDRNSNNPCPEGEHMPTDVKLRWIQIVKCNCPAQDWKVDYAVGQTGNPFYSQQDIGKWGFTTAADDLPVRQKPVLGTIMWDAELALVCVCDKQIGVMGSFTYGFKVPSDADPNFVVPSTYGSPSQTLMTTLKADQNASGWSIAEGCCCIPEPATALLFSLGIVMLISLKGSPVRAWR